MKLLSKALSAITLARHNFVPEGQLSTDWAREQLDIMRFRLRRQLGLGPWGEMELGSAPGWSDLKNFAVMKPDQVEAIRQPLYDTILYPTAGLTQLKFFQIPQGQGLSAQQGNANNVKTLADTNMEQPGTLPSPKAFLATSLEVIFEPGSVSTANTFTPQGVAALTSAPALALNDILNVVASGWLDMYIINKSYLQMARMDSFPPKAHLQFDGGIATTVAATTAAIAAGRAIGRPFYINPPVLLLPTTSFNVTLNWPVAIATPSGFNGRFIVRKDGFMYRAAQ